MITYSPILQRAFSLFVANVISDFRRMICAKCGFTGYVEKVEYVSRLKELVAGERASIQAIKREMQREQQEQAEQRTNVHR